MSASDLGLLLGDHRSLRLVVLNSCESARASNNDLFPSTAAVLTRRGIPAVVAMQYDITDDAAITFARDLYGAVAGKLPVDHAVTRARRAIKLTRRDSLEWGTPVLYLRSANATLFGLQPGRHPAGQRRRQSGRIPLGSAERQAASPDGEQGHGLGSVFQPDRNHPGHW